MMRLLPLAVLLLVPGLAAQQPFPPVASKAQSALRRGNVEALVQGSERVQLRFPGATPRLRSVEPRPRRHCGISSGAG